MDGSSEVVRNGAYQGREFATISAWCGDFQTEPGKEERGLGVGCRIPRVKCQEIPGVWVEDGGGREEDDEEEQEEYCTVHKDATVMDEQSKTAPLRD